MTSLENHLSRAQGENLPTGFGVTFAAVVALIYWFEEFPLSAVANRFELRLRCQLKQLLLLNYKISPVLFCYEN